MSELNPGVYLATVLSLMTDTSNFTYRDAKRFKPERKCLLKGCENMTTHSGGFCCAEHCRRSKR